MANEFHFIKTLVRDQIIKQHGTITAFIERFPNKGFTKPKISAILNGSQNCTLATLDHVLECLNLELTLTKRIKAPILVKRKPAA